VDWFKDFEKWLSGGVVGAVVYGALRLREQMSNDRRGERADDVVERRHEVESYEKIAQQLNAQWMACLARAEELEKDNDALQHENRQLQTKIAGYEWMESGTLTAQALRRLADEMEARERAARERAARERGE
jgi:gas vesicle protein